MYPPIVFTTIRHFYPEAATRFPALQDLPHMHPLRALLFSSLIYLSWQGSALHILVSQSQC